MSLSLHQAYVEMRRVYRRAVYMIALVGLQNGETPLHRALANGHKVALLLDCGANVNAATKVWKCFCVHCTRPLSLHRAQAANVQHTSLSRLHAYLFAASFVWICSSVKRYYTFPYGMITRMLSPCCWIVALMSMLLRRCGVVSVCTMPLSFHRAFVENAQCLSLSRLHAYLFTASFLACRVVRRRFTSSQWRAPKTQPPCW